MGGVALNSLQQRTRLAIRSTSKPRALGSPNEGKYQKSVIEFGEVDFLEKIFASIISVEDPVLLLYSTLSSPDPSVGVTQVLPKVEVGTTYWAEYYMGPESKPKFQGNPTRPDP